MISHVSIDDEFADLEVDAVFHLDLDNELDGFGVDVPDDVVVSLDVVGSSGSHGGEAVNDLGDVNEFVHCFVVPTVGSLLLGG